MTVVNGSGAVTGRYIKGINLIKNETSFFLYNAHGDVVQLTNASGAVTKNYKYDAFGNELNSSEGDTNPWRYCGEYFDKETETYYLRARYYSPGIGRFLAEDTHWNPSNMIYGDSPLKINERKDALGLNIYTLVPDISAIRQSSNLYVYCGSNPIMYIDPTGEIAFFVITGIIGAVGGAIYGGVKAAVKGENVVKGAVTGAVVGGAIGITGGAAAGVLLAGGAAATKTAVVIGAKSLAAVMSTEGLAAGGAFVMQSLRNATSSFTVLGSYPGYLDLAKQLKARVFSIPTQVWNSLSQTQQWALNKEFLQTSINRGDQFILSVNAYSAKVGTYFYSEIQFLLKNGYRIVDEGWRLMK